MPGRKSSTTNQNTGTREAGDRRDEAGLAKGIERAVVGPAPPKGGKMNYADIEWNNDQKLLAVYLIAEGANLGMTQDMANRIQVLSEIPLRNQNFLKNNWRRLAEVLPENFEKLAMEWQTKKKG